MNRGTSRHAAWLDLVRGIPEATGLYCVWNGSEILYIGTSKNLRQRLMSHTLRDVFAIRGANAVTFVALSCEESNSWISDLGNRQKRLSMEKWLIGLHHPPLNGPGISYRGIELVRKVAA
jgi:excinuclease UvrABC nuclease subunit